MLPIATTLQDPLRRNPPSAQRRFIAWWVTRRVTMAMPHRSAIGAANLSGAPRSDPVFKG
jgi:hypothetical protein